MEAVLFLAREPLNSRKLSQYANLADGTEARTLIRRLNKRWDARDSAFRVEEVAGGYQILTRPQFARWLRRLEYVPKETRLSAPALETLAVVAYRQPIARADVEAVRGVSCGEILRQLMERDLVRIGGRSDELGRAYLYATTRRFLQLFGLRSLEMLPRADWIRQPVPQPGSDSTSETDEGGDKEKPIMPTALDPQADETLLNGADSAVQGLAALETPVRAADEEEDEFDFYGDDDEEDDDVDVDEDDDEEEEFDDYDEADLDEEDDEDDDGDDGDEEWEEVGDDDDEDDEDDDDEEEDWDDEDDDEDDWGDDDEEEEEDDWD